MSVTKLFKKFTLYDKYCYLASIYPALIYFLETIHKENNDTYVAFLSRDAYFLYLIYKQIAYDYEENKDYSYIYASRKCFTNRHNSVYKDYILSLLSIKKKLLLVDIYGSGKTFVKFINQYSLENINLLFFSCRKRKKLAKGFYKSEIGFVRKNNVDQFSLECLFRAPNNSVTHLSTSGNNFIAHYEKPHKMDGSDTVNDIDKNKLIKLYLKILENMPYNKNIRYFTLNSLDYLHDNKTIPINNEKQCYNGLLVFDIDDVLTNVKDYSYVKTIVNNAIVNNIKIILVTARQWPFTYGPRSINQKISSIEDILKNIGFNYHEHLIDVWYNPFTFIKKIKPIKFVNNKSVSVVKYETIKKVMESYNIECYNVIYFDDCIKNINECKKLYINTYIVKKNEGINKVSCEQFDKFLNTTNNISISISNIKYNKFFKIDPDENILKKLIIYYTDISNNNIEVEFIENQPIVVNNIKKINKATYGSEKKYIDVKKYLLRFCKLKTPT